MTRALAVFCTSIALAQSPTYANTTLSNVLIRAYGLKAFRVDGPSWIFTDRYDIQAKAPDNTPKDQIPVMLQALLTEGFQLKLRHESHEMSVYFLVTGKGAAKYQKSEGEPGFDMGNGRRVSRNHTMAQLADTLTFTVQRPVLDRTGLSGTYNIPLEMSQEEMGKSDGSFPSIVTILENIGLKLESRKAPLDVIVVDSGNIIPTEN